MKSVLNIKFNSINHAKKLKIILYVLLIVSAVAFLPALFQTGAYARAQTPAESAPVLTPNDIAVKTGDYEAVFSKEGACLKNYKLTNQKFQDNF
ncbi:MAG TPA: hypothetical protein PK467_01415, partial [Candidatus Wallbacteria bacterium]|nr:hypothetical protein [Candidatus Wallbacteria bacterium]